MAARKFDHELVIAELRRGTERAVIAEMVGCSQNTVATIATRNGLAKTRARKYDRDLILSGLEAGKPFTEIAALAGCSVDYVRRIANEPKRAAGRPSRAPSSPTQTAALYEPMTGVREEDAARVRADLEKRGPDFAGLLAMLGLVPEVAA